MAHFCSTCWCHWNLCWGGFWAPLDREGGPKIQYLVKVYIKYQIMMSTMSRCRFEKYMFLNGVPWQTRLADDGLHNNLCCYFANKSQTEKNGGALGSCCQILRCLGKPGRVKNCQNRQSTNMVPRSAPRAILEVIRFQDRVLAAPGQFVGWHFGTTCAIWMPFCVQWIQKEVQKSNFFAKNQHKIMKNELQEGIL